MGRLISISILWLCFISLQNSIAQDLHAQLAQIDTFLSEKYNKDTPGCLVGIIKNGALIYNKGFGMANLDFDIPMTSGIKLNIMSVSKQFTAACVALLSIEQKLTLDDDIHKYIPELPQYGHKITIENLIRHTSGIRDIADLVELSGKTPEDVANRSDALTVILRQRELNFPPGERFAYSNSGYVLLTYVIERVSGTSFSEFAKKKLFDPLGMSSSFFSDDPHQVVKNRAISYGQDETGNYFGYNLNDNRLGCAGLFTTIADLYKWDQNFYDGKVGGEKFLQLMLSLKPFNSGEQSDYAFGNIIDRHEGFKEVLHSGGLLGIRCKIARFPTERVSIIYLGNATQNVYDELYPTASLLLINKSLPRNTPKSAISFADSNQTKDNEKANIVSGNTLRSYAGAYYSEELRAFCDLKNEQKNLTLKLGQKVFRAPVLSETNQMRFNHPQLGLEVITFSKAESNAVNSFTVTTDWTSKITFKRTNKTF